MADSHQLEQGEQAGGWHDGPPGARPSPGAGGAGGEQAGGAGGCWHPS